MTENRFEKTIHLHSTFDEQIKKEMYEENKILNDKCISFGLQCEDAKVGMDTLDDMAHKLLARYSQISAKTDDVDPLHKGEVLEGIVNHSLIREDSLLLCALIKHFFVKILKKLHAYAPKYKRITTVKMLHRERIANLELARIYDIISEEMGFDNSGRGSSSITQLYSFVNEFVITNTVRNSTDVALSDTDLNNNPEMMINNKIMRMDITDERMIQYARNRVFSSVQSPNLKVALLTSLNILTAENKRKQLIDHSHYKRSELNRSIW